MIALDEELLVMKMAAALVKCGHGQKTLAGTLYLAMKMRAEVHALAIGDAILDIPLDRVSYLDQRAKLYAETTARVVRNDRAT